MAYTIRMDETRLEQLREHINSLDREIVELLNKRAEVALAIGNAKGSDKVYDPSRENVVLQHIVDVSTGPLPKGSLEDIYAAIITACREIQIK
jgi:chorismate mutase